MKIRLVKFGEDAKQGLMEGVDLVADAVASTIGPCGRDVIIDSNGDIPPIITNDGVTIATEISVKDRLVNLGAKIIKQASQKTNDDAGDGPQPLYSKILTPNGFIKMGDVKVGDEICGTNCSTQKVLGVFKKGKKEIYRVTLNDGRVVECCSDHLWGVTTNCGKYKIITTRQMLDSGKIIKITKDGRSSRGFYLPNNKVEFSEKNNNIELDPYLLGALIGDGSMSGTGSIELSLGINKEHILDKIKLPSGISFRKNFVKNKNYFRVKFNNITKFRKILDRLGLYGKRSVTKFIPKEYLYSSLKTRKALLQGLIDTDGHINKRGLFEFSTVSPRLALDFIELCRSLGMNLYATIHSRKNDKDSYSDKPIYRISQLVGRKYGHAIESIESTGEFTEMQCIKVSNPDGLYITNDYVVTHNTSCTAILTRAVFKDGHKMVTAGANPNKVKEGIIAAAQEVVEELEKHSTKINDAENRKEKLIQVAKISGQRDDVGEVLGEVFDRVGSDSLVTIEDSSKPGIEYEISDGFSFPSGWVNPALCTNQRTMVAEMDNAKVLVTNASISNQEDMVALMVKTARSGNKNLVIVARDFSSVAYYMLMQNHLQGIVRLILIKAPYGGDRQKDIISDIANVVGATLIDIDSGMNFLDIDYDKVLGSVDKIICEKNKTVIYGDRDDSKIENLIAQIKLELESEKSEWRQEQMKERIACLNSGIAIIKVGAHTDVERMEIRYKVEDAINATRAAIEEGFLPGGGIALAKIAEKLLTKKFVGYNEDFVIGYQVACRACLEPARQIIRNAGENDGVIMKEANSKDNFNYGWNADTSEFGDLVEMGVIDPTKVVKHAVLNSASAAATLLVSNVSIIDDTEAKKDDPKNN